MEIKTKDNIKNKNLAFYLNYSLGSPPLELHISAIKYFINKSNKITVYICDKSLSSCTANPLRSISVCLHCKFRALSGLKTITGDINIKKINLQDSSSTVPLSIKNSLLLGVMSSMASAVKAQNYDQLNDTWKCFHDRMYVSAKKLFNYFVHQIQKNNYDYIFMFNGRFGDVKPVLEATRFTNINYGLLEVKKSLHELVFINELIHSIDGNTRRALYSYDNDKVLAAENAEKFFNRKINKLDTGDPIYTQNQHSGLLPDILSKNKKQIVVVYPTTDDEYKFIGTEWDGYVPEDQVDEIDQFSKNLDPRKFLIIVKMHPNQAHTAENIIERYTGLAEIYDHVHVELPHSRVDSYALMRVSDYILNFASTIGVEACYAGKVVVSIGDTTFSKMKISHNTKSGIEAARLISCGNLTPKPKLGAIIWGNYLASYSDSLPSFSRVSNGVFHVDGSQIGASRLYRIFQLPAKLRLELSKPGFKIDKKFMMDCFIILKNILLSKWTVK